MPPPAGIRKPAFARSAPRFPRPATAAAYRPAPRAVGPSVIFLWFLLLSTGCNRALIDGQNAFRDGQIKNARAVFDVYAKGEGKKKKNRVIALLELGATQQVLGDFQASNHSLAQAEAAIDRYDESPEISLTTEARALLVNLNQLPYRGWDSDRIMAATLRALNFLLLHDPGSARASLNRAYRSQQDAIARNAKELDAANRATAQYAAEQGTVSPRTDSVRALSDPRFAGQFAQRYGYLSKYEKYADYANPFAELLQGLYFLHLPADFGDAERARKSLERTAGMAPGNTAVVDDLRAASDRPPGDALPPTAHIFFATGTSPHLDAVYVELPLFLVSRNLDYFAVNFPYLVENPRYLDHCIVEGGGAIVIPQPLADLDAVVGQDFKNRLPMIIVKSTLSASIKAAGAYAFNQGIRRNNSGRRGRYGNSGNAGEQLAILFARIAAIGYQAATNQADRRIWSSLPKQIHYGRLPMPADGKLQIAGGPAGSRTLTLDPTASHGIWIRSINPADPLIIQSFPFRRPARDFAAPPSPGTPSPTGVPAP